MSAILPNHACALPDVCALPDACAVPDACAENQARCSSAYRVETCGSDLAGLKDDVPAISGNSLLPRLNGL